MNKKIVIAVAALVVVAVGAYFIIRYQADRTARQQVESMVFRIPDVQAIDYETAEVDWQSSRVRIGGVTVSLTDPAEKIRIDEILIHDGDLTHDVPDSLDVEIRGVHLRADQPRLEDLRPWLEGARYEELTLNIRCTYRYDRSSQVLSIDSLTVEAPDAGRLTARARFNNINLPRLVKNMSDKIYLITTVPGIAVAEAEIIYADATLARRLLTAWGRRIGRSPDELSQALDTTLDRELGQGDSPYSRDALNGLKSFVADPQTLRVSAAPPVPVTFIKFLWARQPADYIELLHIRVGS